jgi:tRNA dimethylallyltransferase
MNVPNQTQRPFLLAVMGPTASGKSALAEALADQYDAQLINADAFQVYRGMDIGTAKPKNTERYKLIDIKNPDESFGVGEFVRLAQEILQDLWECQRNVIVVGGTGLYVRALMEQYTLMAEQPAPELRAHLNTLTLEELVIELQGIDVNESKRIDLKNRVRVQRSVERLRTEKPSVTVELPPFQRLKVAVVKSPAETLERIERRVTDMLHNGWVSEVKGLMEASITVDAPGMRALGYQPLWHHLNGEIPLEEATATTIADTRKYAKRQRTWLRSEPNLVELEPGCEFESAVRHICNAI